jgi:hypothetical protein
MNEDEYEAFQDLRYKMAGTLARLSLRVNAEGFDELELRHGNGPELYVRRGERLVMLRATGFRGLVDLLDGVRSLNAHDESVSDPRADRRQSYTYKVVR